MSERTAGAAVAHGSALLALLLWASCGGERAAPEIRGGVPGPEFEGLLVLMVVDQLPGDLLERYDPAFSGGFRRLLDEGRVFSDASHDHARTTTAPGHTTIATGVYPYRHGIVDNSWREPTGRGWALVDNFLDSKEAVVGWSGSRGFSPRKLEVEALADWLVAADPEARVLSISGKVRGAVPLAGHGQEHVYVLSDDFGPAFVTSTYYRRRLPGWVRGFNEGRLRELLADSVWESTVPRSAAALSRPDSSRYERRGVHWAFPHRYKDEEAIWGDRPNGFLRWFWHTPMLDEATIEFALAGVEALELGQRGSLDLLALGLSATDPIGHAYGPYSREQLDNLLRLDRELGRLLAFLEETIGPERLVFALSSDHGVMPAPEYLSEQGKSSGRVSAEQVRRALAAVDAVVAGTDSVRNARRATVLEAFDFVADAMPVEELEAVDPAASPGGEVDSFAVLYRRSFRPDRRISPGERGILVRLREGYFADEATTTHGSPYAYDRHVPMIFMGRGVEPGRTNEHAATLDLAPTLARLAGIPVPEGLDGRVLTTAPPLPSP